MMKATGVSFYFGKNHIIKNMSLDIYPGQFTAIIGPNGSGKTTFMRILNGDYKIHSGQIIWNNKPLDSYSLMELARNRSVLEQQLQSTFPFTGKQILDLCPFMPTEEDFNRAIEAFTIAPLLKKRITSMSGGEVQRLHAARVYLQALASQNPHHCIFLDEPTSALDIGFQIKVMGAFKKLCVEKGLSVCGIFHDLNLIKLFADRLLMIKNGETFACGEVHKILTEANIKKLYDIEQSPFLGRHMQNDIISHLA